MGGRNDVREKTGERWGKMERNRAGCMRKKRMQKKVRSKMRKDGEMKREEGWKKDKKRGRCFSFPPK